MIAILMATYNGQAHLAEQIDSILGQTEQRFTLHIADDSSQDNTYAIAASYEKRYPGKVIAQRRDKNSGHSKRNFYNLMQTIKADYVMLSDQDDVWLDTKIEKTLAKMHAMEAAHGRDLPLLVHTDMRVVDASLQTIHDSFWAYSSVDVSRTALRQVVVQNLAAGCTSMYNRALANFINEEPDFFCMHDWWAVLLASAFGKIGCIPDKTSLYRQHSNNVLGALDTRSFSYFLRRAGAPGNVRQVLWDTCRQANALYAIHRARLSPEQQTLLKGYAQIPDLPKLSRMGRIISLGTWKNGVVRCGAELLYV